MIQIVGPPVSRMLVLEDDVREFAFKGVLVALALSFGAAPSVAAGGEATTEAEDAAATRMTIAGRQRMLVEGMASSLCFAHAGIEVEESRRALYVKWNVYSWYHRGIYHGNAHLNLTKEQDNRIVRRWQETNGRWQDLSSVYRQVLAGEAITAERFEAAMALSEEVGNLNNALVVDFRTVYADEISNQGLGAALLLDLYERQRMLAQKISKNVCLIESGYNADVHLADLQETVGIFENSLTAFIEGMPMLGIPPAPTDEIRARLERTREDWAKAQPIVKVVAEGGDIDQDQLALLHHAVEVVTGDMTGAIQELVAYETALD